VVVVVLVPGLVAVSPVPVCVVVVEFVELTVALVLLSSPLPMINSAARKPTAIASTAMIQVLAPRRSIAAAR
jgi:hypothetical protein